MNEKKPAPVYESRLFTGIIQTPAGAVRQVRSNLDRLDKIDHYKARLGIDRMNLIIAPGLYAVGNPKAHDILTVSANYKPSFDALRSALHGINAWILVLDTYGINVWCAAGKGTFGTDELIRRINITNVKDIVSHRRLIVPQLGAPGIAAHEVKNQSGFQVIYGPVRASDLKAFLESGLKACPQMRRVKFTLSDRIAVSLVELRRAIDYFFKYLFALSALSYLVRGTIKPQEIRRASIGVLGALFMGTGVFPALLPWLPSRAFTIKGAILGLFWGLTQSLIQKTGWLASCANMLISPAISAFLGLNYTGSTTFTSQTGVNKEISQYARLIAVMGLGGAIMHCVAFLKGEYQ